ncbi:energy-coupling factor transporter ATPase [Mahella sp.]|uniref:energy-coupling factor transporter ATPase n=1 Tax=Mahella sp. TaxID=2798721 RepID=UPI0025BB1FE2|nr:energy-coupling factor transporter ATPase [Mahella sp.]MBZ4666341.1 transporter related protein [Mahella sp.]
MSIVVKHLTHIYMQGTPFESIAISDVSFEISAGEFIGLIGHTGSGKSTLIQHLNGLLKPTSGSVIIDGMDLSDKSTKIKDIRHKVGLVFQYPEQQLFEETIYKDIAFGPINMGIPDQRLDETVRHAMELVGLDYDELKERSPFELSGGQRRRVALAGVLAMNPEILILDEPTAGLDPVGREALLTMLKELQTKNGITIIMVSHSMEDVSRLADRIMVMNKGRLAIMGKPEEVFSEGDMLKGMGLGLPQITELMQLLAKRGKDVNISIFSLEQAVDEILKVWGGKALVQ